MNLQIVLMRHATRSVVFEPSSQTESALNAQGLQQAQDLVAQVQSQGAKFAAPTRIFSSPKLRARQTVKPLADSLGLEPIIMDDLDERRDSESLSKFENRVRTIATTIQKESGIVVLCTHLDVLEAAAQLWPTDLSEQESARSWSTLEYQVFNVNNGLFQAAGRGRV